MENNITLEMTSDLFKIISVGTYNTELDSNYVFEYRYNELSDEGCNLFDNNFNNEMYMNYILKCAEREILKNENEIKEILKPIGFVGFIKDTFKIHSPKYYNFSSDILYFDIDLNMNVFVEYVNKLGLNNDFNNFLSETYKSSDGYMNYMPNSYDEVIEKLNESVDLERLFCVVLEYFISKNTEYNNLVNDMEYMFNDSVNEISFDDVISDVNVLNEIV